MAEPASTPARWTKPICGRRWHTSSATRSEPGWCGRRGGTRGPVRAAHVDRDRADFPGLLNLDAWLREWKAERWRAQLRCRADGREFRQSAIAADAHRAAVGDGQLAEQDRACARPATAPAPRRPAHVTTHGPVLVPRDQHLQEDARKDQKIGDCPERHERHSVKGRRFSSTAASRLLAAWSCGSIVTVGV